MAPVQTEDDYDLQQAWKETLVAFAATAKVELKPNKTLTVEDVLAQLKSKREKEEADGAKYRVAKDVIGKTLTCIQTLGSVAASTVSMVFGPVQVGFSAVSFLITAGQNYSNIFSSLTELFKQVTDVMERFVVYLKMKEIDRPLRKIVHELLQCIVGVCACSIKVLHGNKILKFLKVFAFNGDDGVSGELAKLKSLVERELQMKTTLTYQIVKDGYSETKEAVSSVRSTMEKMELETADRKQLDKIKVKLGIDKVVERQASLNTHYWSEIVSHTGSWLREDPAYLNWADVDSTSKKLLLLSGNEGYGKSFLLTSIIHDLQTRYARSAEVTSRTTIAFYYVPQKDAKSNGEHNNGSCSMTQVFKALAFQLTQEPVYRKDVAALCESWVEPENMQDLFFKLFGPCYKSTETYYLIIDAINHVDDRQLRSFAQLLKAIDSAYSPAQQSHVRLLLSGKVQTMQDLVKEASVPNELVDLASRNRPDIESFIRDGLSHMKLLQGESDQVKTLREEIFQSLSAGARGDFVNVDLLMKEISIKQWPAQIREVLEKAKAGGQRSDTIAREIARCNETLAAQEISDLNTLLQWVMSAKRTMTTMELTAVLFLQNNETSLRPLSEQIQDRYSAFFHLDPVDSVDATEPNFSVKLTSDSIQQFFKDRANEEIARDNTLSKIQESEVKIVKRFLASVCDEELFEKFGFAEFFNQKLNSTTKSISVDLENAATSLLLGCLRSIDVSGPELLPLNDYAMEYFPGHMADTDLSLANPAEKTAIGKHLLSLFTKTDSISRWWNFQAGSRFSWFYSDKNVDVVLSFFKDSAITKNFSEEDKEWIKQLTSNSSVDSDVLQFVVAFLAKILFFNTMCDQKAMYSLVEAYLSKIKHRSNQDHTRIRADILDGDIRETRVQEVFRWAAKVNKIEESNYDWNRGLSRLLRLCGLLDAAVRHFQHTITLHDNNWSARHGLGLAFYELKQYDAAIATFQGVLQMIAEDKAQMPDVVFEKRQLRMDLAKCFRAVGKLQEALELYNDHLQDSPADYLIINEKLIVLKDLEQHEKLLDELQALAPEIDPMHGISRLSRLYHVHALNDDFHDAMGESAARIDSFSLVKNAYEAAIEDTRNPAYLTNRDEMKAELRIWLSYVLAEQLWKRAKSEESKKEAISVWEQVLEDAKDLNWGGPRSGAKKQLARVYVDQIRSLNPRSAEAESMMEKILEMSVDDTQEQDAWESTVNASLLLARYYKVWNFDKEAADLTRSSVKVGLDLLLDEDPANDWQGYLRLATTLMYVGDDDNALAAWSLLGPTNYTDKTASESEGSDTEDGLVKVKSMSSEHDLRARLHGPLDYYCDADCGGEWTFADDICVCKDCLDVMFHSECVEKLRSGTLGINICSPDHEFLHVPAWDLKEARTRGNGSVQLRGKNVPIQDWLKDLRKTWRFSAGSSGD